MMSYRIINEQAKKIQELKKQNNFINKCYYKFQKDMMKVLDKVEKRIKKLEKLKKGEEDEKEV